MIKFSKSKVIMSVAGLLFVFCAISGGLRYSRGINATKEPRPDRLRSQSAYTQIILNSSEVQKKEYPLRGSLSGRSADEVQFLDPQQLKDNTKTVIVVLGDRPLDDTFPTVDMVYRVLKGVELAKKFPGAVLIMSGGATKGPTPEARMMGLIAWSRGVDPLRIILEDKSQTTGENAGNTAGIVGSKNIQQVFIITEKSRLEEAVAIFQKHGEFKNVQGIESDVTRAIIMEQMEQYLKTHDDRVVRGRLHFVRKGITSKSFKYAVFQSE